MILIMQTLQICSLPITTSAGIQSAVGHIIAQFVKQLA